MGSRPSKASPTITLASPLDAKERLRGRSRSTGECQHRRYDNVRDAAIVRKKTKPLALRRGYCIKELRIPARRETPSPMHKRSRNLKEFQVIPGSELHNEPRLHVASIAVSDSIVFVLVSKVQSPLRIQLEGFDPAASRRLLMRFNLVTSIWLPELDASEFAEHNCDLVATPAPHASSLGVGMLVHYRSPQAIVALSEEPTTRRVIADQMIFLGSDTDEEEEEKLRISYLDRSDRNGISVYVLDESGCLALWTLESRGGFIRDELLVDARLGGRALHHYTALQSTSTSVVISKFIGVRKQTFSKLFAVDKGTRAIREFDFAPISPPLRRSLPAFEEDTFLLVNREGEGEPSTFEMNLRDFDFRTTHRAVEKESTRAGRASDSHRTFWFNAKTNVLQVKYDQPPTLRELAQSAVSSRLTAKTRQRSSFVRCRSAENLIHYYFRES